ncbi:MAG: hypothetical protein ACOC9O_01160 [Myxococcota bacterium]
MSQAEARMWLVKASLGITAATLVFFISAPAMEYPLEYRQSFRVMQIVLPVFLGYLGSASQFLFRRSRSEGVVRSHAMLGLLVKGPILIFALALVAALVAFGYTNRRAAPIGQGMSVDELALAMSLIVGLLAATTGVLMARLFPAAEEADAGE